MKKSVSSVLAERIKERRAVTPAKIKVRYVKFSPEEMAYEIPADVSHLPFKRARKTVELERARKTVELEEDVAKVFRDSATVNNALRKLIQAMPSFAGKRKSA